MEKGKLDIWIKEVHESGLLCDDYYNRYMSAKNKKQIIDLGLDANGVSFMCEARLKNHPLSNEIISELFGNMVNGEYIYKHEGREDGYTSCVYFGRNPGIRHITTSLVLLLGFEGMIMVEPNSICKIYCDSDTKVTIMGGMSSVVRVHEYSGSIVKTLGRAKYNFEKHK